jgi:hypothetical protein
MRSIQCRGIRIPAVVRKATVDGTGMGWTKKIKRADDRNVGWSCSSKGEDVKENK